MSPLKLELVEGWTEVAPRADGPDLIAEVDGRVVHLSSDFGVRHDFGSVGPVECPLALDPLNLRAFRYISKPGYGRGADYSQLQAFDLKTGKSFCVLELPLNQWVLWLLEWVGSGQGGAGQLLGLLASDRTDERGVVIEHQMFVLKPGETVLRRRPLCRDAYRPLAFSRRRRELVFSGAEGTHLLGLGGDRKRSLGRERCVTAEGAAFDPAGRARMVLAGGGLHLWDLDSGGCEPLHPRGRFPVWSGDGHQLYFRESSSDLNRLDFRTGEVECLLAVCGQRERELWFAQPIRFSRGGRYAAVSITGRRLRGLQQNPSSGGERERVYRYDHATVVMDFERRELWQCPVRATQIQWIG